MIHMCVCGVAIFAPPVEGNANAWKERLQGVWESGIRFGLFLFHREIPLALLARVAAGEDLAGGDLFR